MYFKLTEGRAYLFLILILIMSATLMSLCIHDGHNWSGDYALYIEQTQAIFSGSLDELYEVNKYSTDHAYRVQGPYLYPMGFPLLLTMPYYFMGMDFIALKVFSGLFFLFSLPLLYKLFRPYFSHFFYPLCIVIAIAFNNEYLSFSDNVYSDFAFLFFSVLTFLQMRRESTITNQLLLGGLIFFCYYIRDIGIIFIPTLLVYQLQLLFIEKKKEKNWHSLLPFLVFASFYLLNALLLPKGNANHYDYLWTKLSWSLFVENCQYYKNLFATYFFIEEEFMILLLIPLLVGMSSVWKKQLYFIVYLIIVLLLHMIWPARQGMRFLFPVLPFLIYFLIKGYEALVAFSKIHQRYPAGLLVLGLCFMTYQSIERIIDFNNTDTNLAYNADTKRMYAYISENIPTKEIIGFEKPRVLRLFANRNSILCNLEHFNKSDLSYLLIRKQDITNAASIPYSKVYETQSLILIHR